MSTNESEVKTQIEGAKAQFVGPPKPKARKAPPAAPAKPAVKLNASNIPGETTEKIIDELGRLFDRWLDEEKYEDFSEYQAAIETLLPHGSTGFRMTQKPFQAVFVYQGTEHTLIATKGSVRHLIRKAGVKVAPKPSKELMGALRNLKRSIEKPTAKAATKSTGLAKNLEADGNVICLKKLCQQLKIDPRLARRKLRKAKLANHEFRDRWCWKVGSPALKAAQEALAPVGE
jgi:hypothetical protein